jgi:hypothetical protein
MAQNKPKGWVKEPVRHGLAAKGIKTRIDATKPQPYRGREPLRPTRIHFEEDSISFHDEQGEVVMWTWEEWDEDPSVALIIANAAYLAGKGEDLREIIRQGGI